MLVEVETSLEASSSFNKTEAQLGDEMKLSARRAPAQRMNSFIRAHDLDLTDENLDVRKSKKSLVPINGNGSGGAIMNALVIIGLEEAVDESSRWSATSSTEKNVSKRAKKIKKGVPINEGPMGSWKNAASGNDVFVWSSKCTRKGHGSDYPVVRSRGLIRASAREVVDLLKDSDRVKSYNKMSLGREDQHVITQDMSNSVHSLEKCPQLGIQGEAKIMSSKCQPPFTFKPLEFKTLFYARQLDTDDKVEFDGVAYITVGRSVWETSEGTTDGSDNSTTRCEILLSVNLVREVRTANGEKMCELTSITHAVSTGVPIFLAKQLGLVAAENHIKDIRGTFEK